MSRPLPLAALSVLLAGPALWACQARTPAAQDSPATASASVASRVATAAAALNPLSNPEEEVRAAMRKLLAATSYQVTMEMQAGARGKMVNQLEFAAPDRFRMTMQDLGSQVIIGNTMHMSVAGRTMSVPLPAGTLDKWRDPAMLEQNTTGMTVQALGSDSVGSKPARKYLIKHTKPQPAEVFLWVGSDGFPIQMQVPASAKGQGTDTWMRYSRFNDPSIVIAAPK
ncbi:hypothetical protein [Luteimonas mephitis]|uniref:hypothetical protein n=1 Tax=Luteimonas mephitis TaxID=83615 RepID=UPI0012EB7431|nr:hypothetical protein [Luteimonas mephitis]